MTIPMLILSFLTLAAVCVSIFALAVVRRSSGQRQLSLLSEHSTQLEELSLQLRNLRARLNMQAYRARKRGESTESTNNEDSAELAPVSKSAEDWKRRMNLQLALNRNPK